MQEIKSKVAGVTYKNADGTSRQDLIRSYCRQNQKLVLQPDPHNPHGNGTAVEILVPTPQGLRQIGFVRDTDLDDQLTDALEADQQITCEILNITGGTPDAPTLGVNVIYRIYEPNEQLPASIPAAVASAVIPPPTKHVKAGVFSYLFIGAILLCILCAGIGMVAAVIQSAGQKAGILPTNTPTPLVVPTQKITISPTQTRTSFIPPTSTPQPEPTQPVISSMSLSQFIDAYNALTDIQKEDFIKQNKIQWVSWTGDILEVNNDASITIKIPGTLASTVSLKGVPREQAIKLSKNQTINFTAHITDIIDLLGLHIYADQAQITP